MTKQADIHALVLELPTGGVIVHIQIGCPDCGVQALTFAAHHLRGLRETLITLIDEFPQHAGKEDGRIVTTGPKTDPTLN